MPRPRKFRFIGFNPSHTYFKPQGIPLHRLEEVVLTVDELETLRLKYQENLDQTASAKKMKISQSTFQRLLSSANTKVAKALIKGKAIRVEGGPIRMPQRRCKNRRALRHRKKII